MMVENGTSTNDMKSSYLEGIVTVFKNTHCSREFTLADSSKYRRRSLDFYS